jgi:hypothetical protein
MRGRSVLVLLLVFGALLALVLRRGVNETDEHGEELLHVSKGHVKQIRVRTERDTLDLVRNDRGEWFLRQPVTDKADDHRVFSLLDFLAPLETKERVAGSRAQQIKYHLDRPLAVLELADGARVHQLAVGRKNTAFDAYYARVDGDSAKVGLIDAHLVENYLLAGSSSFQSHRVAEFRLEDVERVEVDHEDEHVILVRDDALDWIIVQPTRSRAHQASVNGLLRQLAGERMDAYVELEGRSPSSMGLDAPSVAIRVTLSNRRTFSLLVGGRAPAGDTFYATRDEDPRVFTIAAASREEFDVGLDELRVREILGFDPDAVRELGVVWGERTFRATREGVGQPWQVVDGVAPSSGAIETAVLLLARLEGREFFDDPAAAARLGLDPPAVVVEVAMADGKRHGLGLSRLEDEAFARWLPDGGPASIALEEFTRLLGLVAPSAGPSGASS